jgi:hypothetical protein
MAYEENTSNRALIRKGEPAPSDCHVSVFLIFLSVLLTFLLAIGMFHPGI